MTEELFSPLIERAMRVASWCHRSHTRKGSDTPYISHPAGVALILRKAGFNDEQVLAAALLHDVIEDTDYSRESLTAEFPTKVVEYVLALTERKLDEAGQKRPWRERKREHLESLQQAPREARAIALADKFHNLGTLLYDLELEGESVWKRFSAPPGSLVPYFREFVDLVEQRESPLKPLADACRSMIARLESLIEERAAPQADVEI